MPQALFIFHGDLSDLLPPSEQGAAIAYPLDGTIAVKHAIEASGVPHPEVEQIVVGATSVDFAYHLCPGDQVHVYPHGGTPDATPPLPLRPPLPRPARFILDTHLGQLAAHLRLFGFDALYRNDYDDAALAELSAAEARVLLTRDRGLLKRKVVVFGHLVRHHVPENQIVDILRRYDLQGEIRLWQRCLRCNGILKPVPKAAVYDRLEPKTQRYYDEFQQCAACGQVYWRGSHFARMQPFVERVMDAVRTPAPRP